MLTNWKARALAAEQLLHDQQRLIEELNQRAFVVDIRPSGKKVRFAFMRAGTVIPIDFYKLIGDDIDQWKKDLIE